MVGPGSKEHQEARHAPYLSRIQTSSSIFGHAIHLFSHATCIDSALLMAERLWFTSHQGKLPWVSSLSGPQRQLWINLEGLIKGMIITPSIRLAPSVSLILSQCRHHLHQTTSWFKISISKPFLRVPSKKLDLQQEIDYCTSLNFSSNPPKNSCMNFPYSIFSNNDPMPKNQSIIHHYRIS